MSTKFELLRRLIPGLLLAQMSFALADSDISNGETRCDELGNNCMCPEALGMTDFDVHGGNPSFKDPNDSVTNECTRTGTPGTAGYASNTSMNVFPASDATVLSALPAGHQVARYIRGPDDHIGGKRGYIRTDVSFSNQVP